MNLGLAVLCLLPSAVRADEGRTKIVAVAVEKIDGLVRKETYKERKAGLDKAYGVRPGSSIGGAGVFTSKILDPREVDADPVRKAVRDAARAQGEDIVFVRTNAKVQVFASQAFSVGPTVGLRAGGIVEVLEVRALPRDRAGAWQHAKERVFLWPLSSEHLRSTLRVGEELAVTGRLEHGTGVGVGFGHSLGVPAYGSIGAGATVSGGHGSDEWTTLLLKKTAPDELRVVLQQGDGESFGAAVSVSAGLDLYDDEWIPRATPETVDQSWVGKGVLRGEESLLRAVEKLCKAELSVSWSHARRNAKAEGWGAVRLDDPRSSAALDDLFHFQPGSLRALPPSATYSEALGAGRFESEVREVTDDATLQARLIKLHATKSAGTGFYEVRVSQDGGAPRRFLMGMARASYRGDVTKTARGESAVMWYDMDSKEPRVTVSLGPEKRLFTTTRETINDVIAAQRALGVPVEGRIDDPEPYLQLFALGNYGRSEENGRFALEPEGVRRVAQAAPEKLVAAYLRADWLYERQSFPPGKNFWGAGKPPAWADTSDPDDYRKVYDYLAANAREVHELSQPGGREDSGALSWMENEYRALAPGRYLRSDAERFLSASAFARHVSAMKGASEDPEKVIELFLQFKKDGAVELKRAVTATASVAGPGNYEAYLELTGKRVELKPKTGAFELPHTPLQKLDARLARWRQ